MAGIHSVPRLRQFCVLTATLLGLLSTVSSASAQSSFVPPPEELSEDQIYERLLRRLDRLEADNATLRERLDAMTVESDGKRAIPDVSQVFVESESAPVLTEEQVKSVVSGVLQERAEWEAEEDRQREQRIASLEGAYGSLADHFKGKKYPTAQLTGVFQADAVWFSQDDASVADYGEIPSGVDIRRFRLAGKGKITEHTNYMMQVDFGFSGRPTIQDLFFEHTDVPILGNVRIGQWKQPFSLEVVSSFRYTTFMERSVLFIPFTPFRHVGVGFYDVSEEQDMTWAASFFAAGQDQFGGSTSLSGGYASAERVTWLPHWDCNGREYLHLGMGHYFSAPNNHSVNFRTQPESFVGVNGSQPGTSGSGVSGALNGTPPFVSTGNLHVDCFNVIGAEFLWVNNQFSLQSETMVNFVNTRDQVGNASFEQSNDGVAILPGTYIQAGYFLTDDYRPYDRKSGAIDRVIPKRSFSFCKDCTPGGWGAWEVAARFSYLDLNDSQGTNVRGGTIADYTVGLNWYTTPYTKVVFNYIHSVSQPGTVTGPILATEKASTDILMTRFQVDF